MPRIYENLARYTHELIIYESNSDSSVLKGLFPGTIKDLFLKKKPDGIDTNESNQVPSFLKVIFKGGYHRCLFLQFFFAKEA